MLSILGFFVILVLFLLSYISVLLKNSLFPVFAVLPIRVGHSVHCWICYSPVYLLFSCLFVLLLVSCVSLFSFVSSDGGEIPLDQFAIPLRYFGFLKNDIALVMLDLVLYFFNTSFKYR